MRKQTYYMVGSESGGGRRWLLYVIFGIAVFLFIFFPFFAVNLRYQLGYIFNQIFDTIGQIALTIGAIMVLISFLGLFTSGRNFRFHYLIIGVVLLWIGSWCTGTMVELFGITIGNDTSTGGYH